MITETRIRRNYVLHYDATNPRGQKREYNVDLRWVNGWQLSFEDSRDKPCLADIADIILSVRTPHGDLTDKITQLFVCLKTEEICIDSSDDTREKILDKLSQSIWIG